MQNITLKRQNFYNIFNTELVPFYKSQESFRVKTLLITYITKIVSCLLFSITLYFALCTPIKYNHLFIDFIYVKCFIFVFTIGLLFYYSYKLNKLSQNTRKKYTEFIKKICINQLLSEFPNYKQITETKEPKTWGITYSRIFDEVETSYITGIFDEEFINDMYIYKTPKKVFYIGEILLKKEKETRYFQYSLTSFKGLVVSFDLYKQFNSKTLITNRFNPFQFYGINLKKISSRIPHCKKFNIYTNNIETEEKEKISPELIKSLDNLKTTFKSKKVQLLIYGNKAILTIESSKDLFEIANITKSYKNYSQLNQFFNELSNLETFFESCETI